MARTLVQLPSTASGMMNVVSSTIIDAIPSTPTRNPTPQSVIHGRSTIACIPPSAGSSDHQRPSDTAKSTRKKASAMFRAADICWCAASRFPTVAPCSQRSSAPTRGIARSAGSTQRL